jgi:hypothetical protein
MLLSTIHRAIRRGTTRAANRTAVGRWNGKSDPANRQPVERVEAKPVELDAERVKRDLRNARERARRAAAKLLAAA